MRSKQVLILAMLLATPLGTFFAAFLATSTASAQRGPEQSSEDYWVDVEEPSRRAGPDDGPRSLGEARGTGRGIVLGRGGGSASPRSVPPTYTVRRGDTLWDITGRFYGNPWQWPRVWSYNPEITNPHWIYPDDTLRLMPEGAASATLPEGGRVVRAGGRAPSGSVLLRQEGFLDKDALELSGIIVGSPEEHMLLSVYDEVYVQFEEGADVRPGMTLTVFRRMRPAERGEEEEGVLVRIFGTVELRSFDSERAVGRGMITEALDPIERGYRVADVPRRFEMVEPTENQVDIEAQVVASLRPHLIVGDYQVVFVSAGSEQGVRVGNRFFMVRQGDEWRESLPGSVESVGSTGDTPEEPPEYPEEIVAEGRVVNVRPNTAALIITRSTQEVVIGDRAEMRQGY